MCQNVLIRVTGVTAALLLTLSAAHAQEDLRESAQNPIADLISLPLQNNMNFGIGDTDNVQDVLNVQPVYPTHLNDSWNLITRPILPTVYQERFFSGQELKEIEEIGGNNFGRDLFGLGDLTPEFFFSRTRPIELAPEVSMVWGAGPHSSCRLPRTICLELENGLPARDSWSF